MVETRERMIETTRQLLRRQGASATGLQQVIDESGAPRGSLYHHFPGGKAQLVAEAVGRSGQLGADHIRDLASAADGPMDAVERFIDDFIAALTSSNFADGCPIATVALETAAAPGPVSDAAASSFTAWIDAFASLLEGSGLDPDVANEVATDVLAHVEGAVLLSKGLRSTKPLELARRSIGAVLTTDNDVTCAASPTKSVGRAISGAPHKPNR